MSTNRGRSLSERLDRDGPESVMRRAQELGGEAPDLARELVALHEKLGSLRALAPPGEPAPPDAVAAIVSKVVQRVEEAGEGDEVSAWRRPAFPQSEEETKAMGDEETTAQPAGEAKEPAAEPSAVKAEGAAASSASAVKRAKEAAPTDSGVVNLKALAEDYYRAKAARDGGGEKPVAAVVPAAAAAAASRPERRRAMGPLLAIAAGLVAVFAVVLYLFLRGDPDAERTSTTPAAGPLVAGGPALMANEPQAPPQQLEAPPPNATAEELERYRLEVEQLKQQLAEQQESEPEPVVVAAAPEAPAEAPSAEAPEATAAASTTPRRTTGGTTSGTTSSGGGTTRPAGGTGSTGTAASSSPPAEAPAANPLIGMLGGRTPTEDTSSTGSGGTTAPAAAPEAPAGGDTRLAGSLTDLGLSAPPRETTSTATTAPATAPAVAAPPPPPPPPEETLPETLGRPEIRRGTNLVKSSVLRCGEGQTGTITVEFTVAGTDGSVNDTRVTGEFAGTAVGACAESAARSASFARFRRSTFTFTFPFVLPVP